MPLWLLFRFPNAPGSIFEEHYKGYYTAIDGTATFDGSDRFARHLFRFLGVARSSTMRILDFGGGIDAVLSRSLAHRFIQHGTQSIEIKLVDYNASCPRECGAITVKCYRSLVEATANTSEFDVVIASAVMEHLPYPRDIFLRLLNSLSPIGRAYFRTPSMSSIIKTAARFGARIDFIFPTHVHDMGQSFWENATATLGVSNSFRVVRSRPSIVETEFLVNPARTVIAHVLKWPWFILRRRYSMVGGWEVVIARV